MAAAELGRLLDVPRLALFDSVGSTLDVAHEIAPGAAAGTLVLADRQTAGRGRQGRRWESPPAAGIWLTLIERPHDLRALDVLSLRCGLLVARALDPLAGSLIQLKWPNDLYVRGRKLAGILIETRWRAGAPDWVAIGMGINVRSPDLDTAVGLSAGTPRVEALARMVPALREAAGSSGHLTDEELAQFRERDFALGRHVSGPAGGVGAGIDAAGELLIRQSDGIVSRHRTGSLTFDDQIRCS